VQLAVDIGNTRVKCGLFNAHEALEEFVSDKEPVYVIKDIYEQNQGIKAIIISSVRKSVDAELIPIPETIHHVVLDSDTPLPFTNLYKSPKTLGRDRIAAIAGAVVQHPLKNCLVIDVGTCLTMDIVNGKGEYLGGSISPGIKLRLTSMHVGTANLPQIDFDGLLPEQIGTNTEDCMKSGAVNGMLNEIRGTISVLQNQFDGLQVLLTGGDAKLFENELKSGIFANPNLVLQGLNEILLYNIGNQ
jgi:type III pantothenate kinase